MKGKKILLGLLLLSAVSASSVMASSALDEAMYACTDLDTIYTITSYMDPGEAVSTFESLSDWERDPKYSSHMYKRTLSDGTLEMMNIVDHPNVSLHEFSLGFTTPKYKDAAEIFFKMKAKFNASFGTPSHYVNEGYKQSFAYDDDEQVSNYIVFLSKTDDGKGHVLFMVSKPYAHRQSYDHSKFGHD